MENKPINEAWQKTDVRYAANDFHIALHENRMRSDGKYYATPVNMKTLENGDIVKDMEAQGATRGIDILVLQEVLASYNAAVLDRVKRGFRVNTGLLSMSLGVHGAFESLSEPFSRGKHSLVVRMTPSADLKDAVDDVNVVIIPGGRAAPSLSAVTGAAESGTLLELRGSNIKLVGDDGAVGVWFVDDEGGREIKCTVLAVNTRSRVAVVVPPLPAGRYRIRLSTQYAGPGTKPRLSPLSAWWGGTLSAE